MIGFRKVFSTASLYLMPALWLAATPLHADDTEVYFVEAQGGGQANIMIMLDTSGSMNWCGASTSTCGDPSQSRIAELKRSFSRLVDGLGSNVRMGIGRLTQYSDGNQWNGGYVIYPMRGLDESTESLLAQSAVVSNLDDATQTAPAPAGLSVTAATITIPNAGVAGGHTGLIFRGLNVPRYARVVSASLKVQAAAASATEVRMMADYQVGPFLPDFATQPIDTRVWNTGAEILIPGSQTWITNNVQYDLDATSFVQAAVNDAGWCGGADVAMRLSNFNPADTVSRRINAHDRIADNAAFRAPQLEVVWDINPTMITGSPASADYESTLSCVGNQSKGLKFAENDADQQGATVRTNNNSLSISATNAWAAFRFPSINFDLRTSLARPDVLNYALLNFRGVEAAYENYECIRFRNNGSCRTYGYVRRDLNGGTVDLEITGVAGNAVDISTANNNISSRGVVTASRTVTVSADADDFNQVQTIDVTDMVREMMSSTSWARGSALMFRVRALDPGSRFFALGAQEGGAANSATINLGVSTADQKVLVPLVRDRLKEVVNSLTAGGATPLAESYTEMSRYMMGLPVDHGVFNGDYRSVAEARTGAAYNSPIAGDDQECASNHVVLMTDGVPQYDGGADDDVESITGINLSGTDAGDPERRRLCDLVDGTDTTSSTFRDFTESSFACMEEMARWNLDAGRNTVERQVNTHMVLFYLDDTTLSYARRVTDIGEGQAINAGNESELEQAFSNIINSVTQQNATLAAPGVAVNQLNRIQHLDQLYFSVFKPSVNTRWQGNLKRYQLGGTIDEPLIVDSNGLEAINPNTGFFKESARSWWSASADGDDVEKGGARSRLDSGERKLFVSLSSAGRGSNITATNATPSALTRFEVFNRVPATELGLPAGATDEVREDLFEFLMESWGDPLHSVPRLVNYGFTGPIEEAVNNPNNQDNVMFVSTNNGALHAIDVKTGEEYFTFVPDDELAKTAVRYSNPATDPATRLRTTYGLDGSWTFWRRANPSNPGSVQHVYAYGGKRRGGSSYYALDVTARTAPRILWQIDDEATGPFSRLGETWSEPALAQVMINGTAVPVLVFGGGYSPDDHDDPTLVSNGDDRGNAIYIVNANNGALIWWASDGATGAGAGAATSVAEMDWSIAANVTPVDVNYDGFIDHIYAADLGGQVFRVDLNKANTGAGSLVTRVERIASLGTAEAAGIENHRRFFGAPAVALGSRDGESLLHVVIGSGYREGPLSEDTQDRMHVLDDVGALQALDPSYTVLTTGVYPITPDDLVDVTSNLDPAESEFNGKYGWRLDLDQSIGEKALSKAAVVQNQVLFTTFNNEAPEGRDACNSVAGSARFYRVALPDGRSASPEDYDNDGEAARFTELNVPGIPPEPQVLLGAIGGGGGAGDPPPRDECPPGETCDPCEGRSDSALTAIIGTDPKELGPLQGCGFRKTRWYETSRAEAEQIFTDEGAVR